MVGSLGNVGQVGFPDWFIYVYLGIVSLAAILDKDGARVLLRQKLVAFIVVILIIVAVFLLMYIYAVLDTRNAGDWMSGRYFLPGMPIFFLLFYNRAIKFQKNLIFYLSVYALVTFTMVFTAYQLYVAYH